MLLAFGVLATGCIEPKDDLDDFLKRGEETGLFKDIEDLNEFECLAPPTGECVRTEGTMRQFLFTFAASIDPTKPILLIGTVAVTGGGATMDVTFQQLSATTRTPVGAPLAYNGIAVQPNGCFDSGLQSTPIDGAANPIIADTPLDVEVRLVGGPVCDDVEFACGVLSGTVLGLGISLDGSTFTAQRINDPNVLPTPVADCDGTPIP